MSLIEEALRKQQDQYGGQRPPEPFSPPPPPSYQSRMLLTGDGDNRQRNTLLVAIAAGVLLLVRLLAGGVVLFLRSWTPPAAIPFVKEVPRTVAAASRPAAPVPPVPVVTAAVQRVEEKPPVVVVAATNPVAPTASVAVASAALPDPIVWPPVTVRGVFTIGGKTMVIFGDGITLETGATAPSGVRLVDVKGSSLRIAYRGEMRLYRQGGGSFLLVTNGAPSVVPAP
jgi:hypothetical protein